MFVVDQNAERGAVEIIELACTQGPEEGGEAGQAKQQGDRDKEKHAIHLTAPLSLRALATTMIDEPDIASAAISGVTLPAMASGTAMAL